MTPRYATISSGRGLGRRVSEIVESAEAIVTEDLPRALVGPGVIPLDALPLAMLVVTPSGEALAVNEHWSELSGLPRSGSLGRGWLGALREPTRQVLRSYLEGTMGSVRAWVVDLEFGSEGGTWTRWWIQPYEAAGERLIGLAVAALVDDRAFWSVVEHELPPVLSRLDALFLDLRCLLADGLSDDGRDVPAPQL